MDIEEKIERLIELKKEIYQEKKEITQDIREFNDFISDYRHILEFGNLNGNEMLKLSSLFSESLKNRRKSIRKLNKIKYYTSELSKHNKLFQRLNYKLNTDMEDDEDKKYYVRSEIGKEFLGNNTINNNNFIT